MAATWILVADNARARLFEVVDGGPLIEIASYTHPEGRAHGRDLTTEGPPTVNESMGPARHSIEPHSTLRDKSAHRFAHELSQYLERGLKELRFDRLALAAPPHFLGILREALGKQIHARLVAELPRELTALPSASIREHLPPTAFG